MNFELNLFENSIEYFFDSLDYYAIANEHGEHDQQRSDLESKKKWKLAFVFIVQAIELLAKEVLYRINPTLIFENIDNPINSSSKTVSFVKLLSRLRNFISDALTEQESLFLNSCANIRNAFVHYKVGISSPELKAKYCKLVSIFLSVYSKFIASDFNYKNEHYRYLVSEILIFDDKYTVFRGEEMTLHALEEFKKEIEANERQRYYIDRDGIKYPRIRFGDENDAYMRNGHYELVSRSTCDFDFCGDCSAKKGEYHLDGCDWEVCPICFSQVLSCDCEVDLCDEEGNIYKSPYSMK